MNIKIKPKPEHGTFRVTSGFAFLPKVITQTKKVWLQRYVRHEVFYGHKWYVCDPTVEMVNWAWKDDWTSYDNLGLYYYTNQLIPSVENPVLPVRTNVRKRRVKKKSIGEIMRSKQKRVRHLLETIKPKNRLEGIE